MSSSPYLEGLEFKEATPSIAPSIYESSQYTRKWRILISVAVGLSLIGVCVVAFYLSAQSRVPLHDAPWLGGNATHQLPIDEPAWQWRSLDEQECLITSALSAACPVEFGEKVTLVIAFGGLRPDQVKQIPSLSELARCGVTADSMVPSYPSFTYTSLYSIATGLYPESHGIVSPNMYDAEMNLNFTVGESSAQNSGWWLGEPIWNTVKKQGKQSATYLWPGSDVKIQNTYPSYWQKDGAPFEERIVKVLDWIKLPAGERPQLIMVYYNEPTTTAQLFGFFSDVTDDALRTINSGMDDLITGLERSDIFRCVNLVLLSDHGTAPSFCEESIFVDDLLADTHSSRVFTGTIGRIALHDKGDKENVLSQVRCQDDKMRGLSKEQVPIRYHYKNNERIGDIVLDTTVGRRIAVEGDNPCLKTEYGYNNLAPSMQSIFIGHGPSFKNGFATRSFRNVEIYNLLSILLEVTPAPNNGTSGGIVHILKEGSWNASLITHPSFEFLDEIDKPRPRRDENTVVGIRGVDDLIFDSTCQCDASYVVETTTTSTTTTTTPPTTTTTTTPTTTTTTAPTTTTTTTTTPTTTIPSSTTSSSTEGSSTNQMPVSESEPTNNTFIELITQPTVNGSSVPELENVTLTPDNSSVDVSITDKEDNGVGLQPIFFPEEPPTEPLDLLSESPLENDPIEEFDILPSSNRKKREVDLEENIRLSVVAAEVSNDTSEQLKDLKMMHAPWGLPRYSAPEVQTDVVNILMHTSHVLGFPASLNLALWTSFTVTRDHLTELEKFRPTVPEGVEVAQEDLKEEIPLGCWMADPRLTRSSTDQCSRSFQTTLYNQQNVSLRQLHPEELDLPHTLLTEGFLLSGLAPARQGYQNAGRRITIAFIEKLTKKFGSVNVVHGPVFDYDHNGKRDLVPVVINTIKPLVPSHYFFAITICNQTTQNTEIDEEIPEQISLDLCPEDELRTIPLIFPNVHAEDNCLMMDDDYLAYHLSSIADIELLTGLRLFRDFLQTTYDRRKIDQPLQIPIV